MLCIMYLLCIWKSFVFWFAQSNYIPSSNFNWNVSLQQTFKMSINKPHVCGDCCEGLNDQTKISSLDFSGIKNILIQSKQ